MYCTKTNFINLFILVYDVNVDYYIQLNQKLYYLILI
jgi:hypothetical protein